MSRISYQDYLSIISDPNTSEEEIMRYSMVKKGEGGFDFQVVANPDKVEMTSDMRELESAIDIGNNLARWRRGVTFRNRLNSGEGLPVLVEEGDSWFQFPFLIKDVIDHLGKDYLIYSVGAAGDTAENIVYGPRAKKGQEYLDALIRQKDHVQGFLFSAAGNDIIGEIDGVAALFDILKPYNGATSDVLGHINMAVLGEKLSFLSGAYMDVVENIRSIPGFETLPIFIHGYDYAYPFPHGDGDDRDPSYAAQNEWLGEPLDERGILDPTLRHEIIRFLVNSLYDMLEQISGDPAVTGVWLIDCRGAMPNLSDWNDEIHGTSEGFVKVADRFRAVLGQVLSVS